MAAIDYYFLIKGVFLIGTATYFFVYPRKHLIAAGHEEIVAVMPTQASTLLVSILKEFWIAVLTVAVFTVTMPFLASHDSKMALVSIFLISDTLAFFAVDLRGDLRANTMQLVARTVWANFALLVAMHTAAISNVVTLVAVLLFNTVLFLAASRTAN